MFSIISDKNSIDSGSHDYILPSAIMDESTQQLNEKCGEIFVERIYDSEVFSFTCVFCDKATFTEISDFFEHFKNTHTKSFVATQKFDPLDLDKDGNRKIIKVENNIYQTDSIVGYNAVILESSELELKNEISDNYIVNTISHSIPSEMSKNDMETTENNIRTKFKFPCEMCGKKYLVESSLRKHMIRVHKNVDTSLAKNSREHLPKQTKKNVEILDATIDNPLNSNQNDEELCIRIRNDGNRGEGEEFAIENLNTKTIKTDEDFDSDDKNSLVNLNKYVQNDSNDSSKDTAKTDENKVFSCKICDRNYQLKSSLNRHMKNVHTSHKVLDFTESSKVIHCTICNRAFTTEKNLRNHVEYDHGSVDPFMKSRLDSLSCDEEDDSNGEDHKKKNSNTSGQLTGHTDPMKCRYCGRRMNGRSKRIEHERIHTGERPLKCKFCDKYFRTSSSVKKHEQIHQGIKPHKCEICNAAFTEKSNLHQHIRRHLGDKKLPCQYCGKLFQQNSERKVHERIHTGEKPFQCSVCGKCFTTSEKLARHALRHTNDKRFKCTICGKKFFSSRELSEHNVSHTGERPFKCDICNATFPRRKSLKSHIKIHSEVAEYVCTICGKGFKQSPGLYCHMKSHGIPIKS